MRIDLDTSRGAAPLYLQVANAIEDVITLDRLRPGDLLPSENALASDNALSRATVIKAYDTLVERGAVTRRQGRGTFVTAKPMERLLPELTSFSEHVHGLGLTPGSTLLSFDVLDADSRDRPFAPFSAEAAGATETVVQIERLRTVGGSPVGIHRTHLPTDIAERCGLTETTVAAPGFSLYRSLAEAGVHLDSAEESLRAINASASDAELLGVDERTALIEVVRASRDADGRLIEVVRARYLGSKYVYNIAFSSPLPGGHHEETHHIASHSGGGLAADPHRLRL